MTNRSPCDRPVEALREAEPALLAGVRVGVRVAKVLRSHPDRAWTDYVDPWNVEARVARADFVDPWNGRWT